MKKGLFKKMKVKSKREKLSSEARYNNLKRSEIPTGFKGLPNFLVRIENLRNLPALFSRAFNDF